MTICLTCGMEFIPSRNSDRIKYCSANCRIEKRNKDKYGTEWYRKNREHIREYRQSISEKRKADRKARYANDIEFREHVKAKARESARRNPQLKKNRHLKESHGITLNEYQLKLKEQNGKCAICGRIDSADKITKYFHVDHDHATGKIRGLLCSNCNLGLGKFKDNADFLLKASEYLRMWN